MFSDGFTGVNSKIKWSKKLADFAQNESTIKGCAMKHTKKNPYGENIYMAWDPNSKPEVVSVAKAASGLWEDEIKVWC